MFGGVLRKRDRSKFALTFFAEVTVSTSFSLTASSAVSHVSSAIIARNVESGRPLRRAYVMAIDLSYCFSTSAVWE